MIEKGMLHQDSHDKTGKKKNLRHKYKHQMDHTSTLRFSSSSLFSYSKHLTI